MIQIDAKINFNKRLTSKYYQMSLRCPLIAKKSLPGQFIHLYIDSVDVFLRRPFSIYNVDNNSIEILYKIVGPGTEYLSAKMKNQFLNILGPLGNGYKIENREQRTENRRKETKDRNEKNSIILVAGGTGVASLFFLAKRLQKNNNNNIKIIVLLGAKNKEELINVNEFKNIGCQIKIATDDGSSGYKGFVPEYLHNLLVTSHGARITNIYSCGPKPMLKEIAKISGIHKIPCQISLEEHMACGVGACMGCVVKIKNQKSNAKFEYKRVCKDGPVFDTQEVVWE